MQFISLLLKRLDSTRLFRRRKAFLTAVERVFLPTGSNAFCSDVKRRALPFCKWACHNRKVKNIYETRNLIAHGQLSTSVAFLTAVAGDAGECAEQVLIGVLLFFGERGLADGELTPEEVAQGYERRHEKYVEGQRLKAEILRRATP